MGCTVSKDNDFYMKTNQDFKDTPMIFVSGLPGAGNRTISDNISKITGLTPIYPGEIIRKNNSMKNKSLSNATIIDMLKEEMLKHKGAKGFIISRFPQNSQVLKKFEIDIKSPEIIIVLKVDDAIAENRLKTKLNELGKSEEEIRNAENIIKTAKPIVTRLEQNFDKDNMFIVNSTDVDILEIIDYIHKIVDNER